MRNIICIFLMPLLLGCVSLKGTSIRQAKEEKVDSYLEEFCTPAFPKGSSIRTGIERVLLNVPGDVYKKVTDRRRPVLFTEVHPNGTARYANTVEIIVTPDEKPAFQNGFTLIKLSTELEEAGSPLPIAGIIAHELAHKYLDHGVKGGVTCQTERETNALVRTWGFVEELDMASLMFGREKTGGPAACIE